MSAHDLAHRSTFAFADTKFDILFGENALQLIRYYAAGCGDCLVAAKGPTGHSKPGHRAGFDGEEALQLIRTCGAAATLLLVTACSSTQVPTSELSTLAQSPGPVGTFNTIVAEVLKAQNPPNLTALPGPVGVIAIQLKQTEADLSQFKNQWDADATNRSRMFNPKTQSRLFGLRFAYHQPEPCTISNPAWPIFWGAVQRSDCTSCHRDTAKDAIRRAHAAE